MCLHLCRKKLYQELFYIHVYGYLVHYINTEFICIQSIRIWILYLMHVQPWNAGFYPWNKSTCNIFTGCYLIKTVVFTAWKINGLDAMSRISCSVQDFKIELKIEENINKKKIHYFFYVEYRIYFRVKQDFYKISLMLGEFI